MLAYATTIHKAQGSEYPIVVMPFTMSHYVMLQRNLLYTGVTRAKKILVMIGEKKAIAYAVRNEKTTQRNTKLAQRLRESVLGENAETAKNSGNILENSENILQKKPPEIPLMAAEAKAVYGNRPPAETNDANLDRSAADSAVLHRSSSINPTASHQSSSSAVPDTAYRRHLFDRLAQSKFRSSFYLRAADKAYIREKGMDTIRSHAQDFVRKRLAPEVIPNDGKQTPMKGHPVFIAQHATGCCCRGCLAKWYGIPAGCELTEEQQEYVVNVLMEWIRRQMEGKR